MKAIICPKYGSADLLRLEEVEKPVPKDNEVLIKNFATTVQTADWRIRSAIFPLIVWLPMRLMMGFGGPRQKILGVDVAGIVESTGKNVKLFKKGDKIFGSTYPSGGGHAEFICLPEDSVLTIKPDSISHEEAVSIFFGGHTALHFLRKGKIQKGQKTI